MTPEFVITFGRDAFFIATLLAGPALAVGLIVGLLVSLLQAVTQIQEITLTIIPKIIVIMLTLAILFPWLLNKATDYYVSVFSNISTFIDK